MENHERETEQARVDNVEKQIDQSTGKEVICYILKYEDLPS